MQKRIMRLLANVVTLRKVTENTPIRPPRVN